MASKIARPPKEHRLKESDRLREDSTTKRGRDPERGIALQFNRFRNPYGTKRKTKKLL